MCIPVSDNELVTESDISFTNSAKGKLVFGQAR